MSNVHTQVSAEIAARPEQIYAVLSDYRVGHPAIVPKPYFTDVIVKQGGQGAGTVIEVHMNVMGAKRVYHEIVSEPEPGRVLVETDRDAGVTSTFTIDPLDNGSRSRVTIAMDTPASPGLKGLLERIFNPPITRRIFRQELQQLAAYVRDTLPA